MARARNIKPGFFRNAELVELPVETRLLFIGLWGLADREGRLFDRPKQIKMEVYPADSFDVDAMLTQLHNHCFIIRYEVNGIKYIQIINFAKHQNPHRDEKASTIPAPCEHDASTVQIGLIPESLLLNPESKPLAPSAKRSKPKIEFDGEKFINLEPVLKTWADAYPAVDLNVELNKAAAWVIANPKNRKSNWAKFLTNWLSRAQDKAPRVAAVGVVKPPAKRDWSETREGVEAKALSLGLPVTTGEHWQDLKERVWDEIRRIREAA